MARASLVAFMLAIVAACGDDDGTTPPDASAGSSGRTSAGNAGTAGRSAAGAGGTAGSPQSGGRGGDAAGASGESSAGEAGRADGGASGTAGAGGAVSDGGSNGGASAEAGAGGSSGEACGDASIAPYAAKVGDPTWPLRSYWCDVSRLCCAEACFDATGLERCEGDQLDQALEDAVSAGTVIIDEDDLATCMQTLRARATDCDAALATTSNVLIDSGIAACLTAVQGTVPEGERCTEDFECAHDTDPAFCIRPDEGYGLCAIARKGQVGDPCFMTEGTLSWPGGSQWTSYSDWASGSTRCLVQDGLYCNDDARCFNLLQEGAECDPGQCAEGLYCRDTCRPLVATGESCAMEEQCAEGTCVDGRCTTDRATPALCAGPE